MLSSPGDNPAEAFLRHSDESDPSGLFKAYAHHLLDSADAWQLPVPLDAIFKQHSLRLRTAPLDRQRGFIQNNNIVVNGDDLATVQTFSQAHELMELLVRALSAEGLMRFPARIQTKFDEKKESWCEQGAAELLMPDRLFFPLVQDHGISLSAGRELSSISQISLTATVRRILDSDFKPCIFALLKEGHKKAEVVPSKVGQGVLWGEPKDWDPPAELRVWRRWRSPQVRLYLPTNKSLPRDTTVYRTMQEDVMGRVVTGCDCLELEGFPDQVETESMLVTINGDRVVMAMLHL